jgi:acyl dehydratase
VAEVALRRGQLIVGQTREQIVVEELTRTQIVQYAGASGDFNPLHTDEIFAAEVAGFPSVIAHGMLTMGMTAHMVTDYVGDARLLSFGGRFAEIVVPGDSLITRSEVQKLETGIDGPIVQLLISTRNSRGDNVFEGYASALILE